jgi:hypothetical protein
MPRCIVYDQHHLRSPLAILLFQNGAELVDCYYCCHLITVTFRYTCVDEAFWVNGSEEGMSCWKWFAGSGITLASRTPWLSGPVQLIIVRFVKNVEQPSLILNFLAMTLLEVFARMFLLFCRFQIICQHWQLTQSYPLSLSVSTETLKLLLSSRESEDCLKAGNCTILRSRLNRTICLGLLILIFHY